MKIFSDSYTSWMFLKDIFWGIWLWLKILWPWILVVVILSLIVEILKRKKK